jgi:hypothetical protein
MITCLFWGYKSRKSAKSAKKGPPDFVFCSVCRRQDLCRQASVFEMDAYAIRSLSWEYRIVSHNSFIFVCSRNNNGKILMKPTRIIEICANSAQSCVEAQSRISRATVLSSICVQNYLFICLLPNSQSW